ncbi:hypothetical protein PAAG_12064 [Paracoccidioides lutzii Pb01]|uniref:Uncharacterized protein n=1 Tax=Paracoccidioides lutzii (strain ATCC MYA-826 / Pb01) TaxID=502779 RepID=A0A0A2V0A7_PARBA|nr:hypothetical protein PAAG_12064 [Paracoccidioides lutzii Pb01]KGQ01206.1 hypothetical protein PAAG_12064 [Paracoccidioides lutzii Pb01]
MAGPPLPREQPPLHNGNMNEENFEKVKIKPQKQKEIKVDARHVAESQHAGKLLNTFSSSFDFAHHSQWMGRPFILKAIMVDFDDGKTIDVLRIRNPKDSSVLGTTDDIRCSYSSIIHISPRIIPELSVQPAFTDFG